MPFSRKSSTGGLVRSAKDTEEELTAKFSAATAKAAQAAQQALRQGDAQKEEAFRRSRQIECKAEQSTADRQSQRSTTRGV